MKKLPIISNFILKIAIVVVPITFVPLVLNGFQTPKATIILISTLIIVGMWLLQRITEKVLRITIHPFSLPLLAMIVATIASLIFSQQHITTLFVTLPLVEISMILLILITTSVFVIQHTRSYIELLLLPAVIVTLISILQIIGVGPSFILNKFFGLQLPHNLAFSLTGSPLASLLFLITAFIPNALEMLKHKNWSKNILITFGLVATTIGIGIHIFGFVTQSNLFTILSPKAGLSIALDTFKEPKQALFGVGVNQFENAYTQYKPVWINAKPYWNATFFTSTSYVLTILVTRGLVGFVAWLFLTVQVARQLKETPQYTHPAVILTITGLVLQLIFPTNMVLIFTTLLGLLLWTASLRTHHNKKTFDVILSLNAFQITPAGEPITHKRPQELLAYFTAVIGSIVLLGLGFFTTKALATEALMQRSLQKASVDAQQTHKLQQRAVAWDYYKKNYHRTYAQTNLALASAISQQGDGTKEQQAMVAQLAQTAIKHAKLATRIDDNNTQNWMSLASIYKALLDSTPGAGQWTIAAYVQAIETSPNNPTLRLELGGVYYGLGDYEQAEKLFEQAATLKPDWANAFYNLANALKKQSKNQKAGIAYQRTLELLEPTSEQYFTAQKEYNQLQSVIEQDVMEESEKNNVPLSPQEVEEQPSNVSQTPEVSELPILEQPAEHILEQPMQENESQENQQADGMMNLQPQLPEGFELPQDAGLEQDNEVPEVSVRE